MSSRASTLEETIEFAFDMIEQVGEIPAMGVIHRHATDPGELVILDFGNDEKERSSILAFAAVASHVNAKFVDSFSDCWVADHSLDTDLDAVVPPSKDPNRMSGVTVIRVFPDRIESALAPYEILDGRVIRLPGSEVDPDAELGRMWLVEVLQAGLTTSVNPIVGKAAMRYLEVSDG